MNFGEGRSPTRTGAMPLMASLLVADRCNHACGHCYQVHGEKGEMTLAQVLALLAELARLGVLFLNVSGGEATLRSDLPEILAGARREGFAITLLTNGYALSERIVDVIVETGVWQVRVSAYSDVAAEHDAVTGVAGSFEKVRANVLRLRARGVRVALVTPLTSLCTASPARLEAFAAGLGCTFEMTSAITAREDGSCAPLALAPADDALLAYYREEAARGVALESVADKLDEPPCGACGAAIAIHSDGSVRPCTHIAHDLARPGASLASLAGDEAFRALADVRFRDLHGCRDCALLRFCSRCHGSAMFERGDLFGPQPSACRKAALRYEAHVGPLRRDDARPDGAGPFAIEPGEVAVLRPIADRTTEHDEALARRFPWIRSPRLLPARRLVRRPRFETLVAPGDHRP